MPDCFRLRLSNSTADRPRAVASPPRLRAVSASRPVRNPCSRLRLEQFLCGLGGPPRVRNRSFRGGGLDVLRTSALAPGAALQDTGTRPGLRSQPPWLLQLTRPRTLVLRSSPSRTALHRRSVRLACDSSDPAYPAGLVGLTPPPSPRLFFPPTALGSALGPALANAGPPPNLRGLQQKKTCAAHFSFSGANFFPDAKRGGTGGASPTPPTLVGNQRPPVATS